MVYHALLLTFLVLPLFGHTSLFHPQPTTYQPCRVGGELFNPNCTGPCPNFHSTGTAINESNPATTWQRGQRVTIKWFRNGHRGGFARLAIVPVQLMNDKEAHERLAFRYSCWEVGTHDCTALSTHGCGTDPEGKMLQLDVDVPTVYPDGVYVLGMAWYGGLTVDRESYFGDYWSCSFVTIAGGETSLGYSPVWESGSGREGCEASVNRLGECVEEPCLGVEVEERVAGDAEEGRGIYYTDFIGGGSGGGLGSMLGIGAGEEEGDGDVGATMVSVGGTGAMGNGKGLLGGMGFGGLFGMA